MNWGPLDIIQDTPSPSVSGATHGPQLSLEDLMSQTVHAQDGSRRSIAREVRVHPFQECDPPERQARELRHVPTTLAQHRVHHRLWEMYRCRRTHRHIPYQEHPSKYIGPFSSINAGFGVEPSRRDDLISLGYMLVYFLKGTLPWIGTRRKRGLQRINPRQ